MNLAIGLCTVDRGNSYLLDTVRTLLSGVSEFPDVKIYIFDCNFRGSCARDVNQVREEFLSSYIRNGQLRLCRVDNHPEFDRVRCNLGDSPDRVRWRTKQNYDYSEAMRYIYNRSHYYLHLEDDIQAPETYLRTIECELSKNGEGWSAIRFAQGGFIGLLFYNADLPKVSALLREFRGEMPCDWLLDHYVQLMWRAGRRFVVPSYSLFQHVGEISSLKGKRTSTIFTNYIGDHF